jgi:predicted nucleic acid-binding Zn ribbon protein
MTSSKIPIHNNSCSNKNKNILKKDLQQLVMTMLLAPETNKYLPP